MTGCPCTAVCRWSIVASLTALCLWQGLVTASAYLESSDAYAYLTAWRAAAKNAPGEKLALLCNDENRVTPVDRSRLIAISWERAPDPLSLVDGSGDLQSVDCVLSSNWHPVSVGKRLVSNGFMVASTNEYAKTWVRKGVRRFVTCSPVADVSQTREALALVLEAVLIFAPLVFAFGLRGFSWWSLAASFLIAAGLGYVALSHPLLAPNGLGTYGGKAKLLYACGGIPESFLNSTGGMALQTSYPPGLTLLAYLHFLLSGGCGDRLVQLVVVFAMAALCLALLRGSSHPWCALPIALYCVLPIAIRITSGFYAEPFVALLLVLGWRMMRNGRLFVGALVMGMAGLFRPEAGVVVVFFAACGCAFRGNSRARMVAIVSAGAPTLIWIATCRLLGYGGLTDWNVTMMLRFGQIVYGALAVLDSLWKQAIPVFVLLFLVRPDERRVCSREVLLCILPVALLGCAIPLVCGFYDAPYAKWMMDNTIPRLIWYLLPVPMFVMVSQLSSHDFGIIRSRKKDKSDV